jgi:PAS domain S-box-containing protein
MSGLGSVLPKLFAGDDEQHSHTVQLYVEDSSLVDTLGRFIAPVLQGGEAAVIVATPEHRLALARNLAAQGVDISEAARQGRYIALDAAETLSLFTLEGWPEPARFAECLGGVLTRARGAAVNPHSPVAVFGEMVALLWAEGKFEAALQLEQLWNDLSRTQSFHLRCAYSVGAFGTEEEAPFLRLCGEHTRVLPVGSAAPEVDREELSRVGALWHQKASLEVEMAGRKKLRTALQYRESELADLLENGAEGVQRTGPDQRVLWANKALLRLLGYTSEEYLGRCFGDFFVDATTANDFWARLMDRQEVYGFPAEIRCKDGSSRHVLIQSNGLWEGDRFVHTRTFIHDVTERMQMEQALQQAHDELEVRVAARTTELREKNEQISRQSEILDRTNRGLRELSVRLLRVQDDERRRIARDLHDGTGQALALLCMNLSALEAEARRLDSKLAQGLAENVACVRQISSDLRTLSYLLHPPLLDEMGLESALRWYVDGFAQRSKVQVRLEFLESWGRLSEDLEIAIFRVVQECLTNVHRHSGSATATIRLYQSSGKVVLEVADEGRGIAAETISQISSAGASGVGLRGIRERIKDFGGDLEVAPGGDGKGTAVRMVIPLTAATEATQLKAIAASTE